MMARLRRTCTTLVYVAVLMLLIVAKAAAQAGVSAAEPSHGMNLDRVIRTFVLAEQLEVRASEEDRPIEVGLVGWIGGDYERVFLRVQGEQSTVRRGGGDLRGDILYGRLVSPYWSVVAGARLDTRPRISQVSSNSVSPAALGSGQRLTRGMLAVGFVGLSPGWFEAEPTLMVSDRGDVSFQFESSIDLLFTQRLIVQPFVDLNAAVQAVREIGVGSGINDVEVGARMRYEVRRKFAPYMGVSLLRRTGTTAAMAKNNSQRQSIGTITAGVRVWR